MSSQRGCASSAVKGNLREDVGHVVKDNAVGCAGPYGAVGKWDNVRIEMHYYFIYTSRVCAKMSLAG